MRTQSALPWRLWVLAVLLICLTSAPSWAAFIASDDASDPAYVTWDPGDNGGSGWGGGWTFRNQSNVVMTTTNGNRGWFVADSRNNNSPAGAGGDSNGDFDINTPDSGSGKAWGLYSNSTDQVYAIRPFGGGPLAVNDVFSFDFDNGNIAPSQVVGVRLLSDANDVNSRVFELRFVGGDSFYTIIAGPNQTTTHGFTREGIHAEYTLTGPSSYSLQVTRLQSGATDTYTGSNVNTNSIAVLAFKSQFPGSGAASDAFFNSISVTQIPEPASLGMFSLCGACFLRRRK
jgi:hypothetical protein